MLFLAGGGVYRLDARLASRDGGRRDLDRAVLSAVVHRRRARSPPATSTTRTSTGCRHERMVIDGDAAAALDRRARRFLGSAGASGHARAVLRRRSRRARLGEGSHARGRPRGSGRRRRQHLRALARRRLMRAPAVATGSHIDAIPNAGRYDGVVGVLGAIAAVQRPARVELPALPIDRNRGLHGGGADAFRHRLPGEPPALRRAFARTGGGARRRERAHARRVAGSRGCSGGRARDRPAPARALCRVRRAAHRTGPAARAVRHADRRRHGDRRARAATGCA